MLMNGFSSFSSESDAGDAKPRQSESSPILDDVTIWENLKSAIANSSGFQRWQLERSSDNAIDHLTLELRVRRYLRETLETLAY